MTYRIEKYWQYALFAAVAIVRASGERAGVPVEELTAGLATRHGIDIP